MPITTRAFQREVGIGSTSPNSELQGFVAEVNTFVAGLPFNSLIDIQWTTSATGQRASLVYTAFVLFWES